MSGFAGLRVYEFDLIGQYDWAVMGDPENRRTIWVWIRPCRWCGQPFYQTTAAVSIHPDGLRMANCPAHRGKPRPDAVAPKGRFQGAITKRREAQLRAAEFKARTIENPANHAAVFSAIDAHLASGGRLCFGGSSQDYITKRLPRLANLTKRQVVQITHHLVASDVLRLGRVGTDRIGRPIKGLIIPRNTN